MEKIFTIFTLSTIMLGIISFISIMGYVIIFKKPDDNGEISL